MVLDVCGAACRHERSLETSDTSPKVAELNDVGAKSIWCCHRQLRLRKTGPTGLDTAPSTRGGRPPPAPKRKLGAPSSAHLARERLELFFPFLQQRAGVRRLPAGNASRQLEVRLSHPLLDR